MAHICSFPARHCLNRRRRIDCIRPPSARQRDVHGVLLHVYFWNSSLGGLSGPSSSTLLSSSRSNRESTRSMVAALPLATASGSHSSLGFCSSSAAVSTPSVDAVSSAVLEGLKEVGAEYLWWSQWSGGRGTVRRPDAYGSHSRRTNAQDRPGKSEGAGTSSVSRA